MCCCAAYDTRDYGGVARVPIGPPLANLRAYVLDEHLQLVPIGVPGELMLSGIQVARGYLHRPELTAEKFIANPYAGGDAHHRRMYRTGARPRTPAAFPAFPLIESFTALHRTAVAEATLTILT